MNVKLIGKQEHAVPPGLRKHWSSIVCHSHMIRSHGVSFEQAKVDLVEWCRKLHVDALGVGSPWEPVSAAHYAQYEREDRDLYYSGGIDPGSVMDREPIGQLFEDLNSRSAGDTFFFQDNETPKGRMCHIWYLGYHYDVPAWHDYSQDRPIQFYKNDPYCEINAITGQPHRRRPTLEIIANQRSAGALAVWAHPTSWWWQGEKFVTNIAAEIVLHLLADGRLDGMVMQGYDACHRWYQSLWFHLLDTGAIVPGFAESDGCFDSGKLLEQETVFRTCLPVRRPFTVGDLVAAARTGNMFATSGAWLTVSVDDVPMGQVLETAPGRIHRVRVEAYPVDGECAFSRLEIIGRGGEVLQSVERFPGGLLEYDVPGGDGPAYVLARGFGEHDDPESARQQDIKHMVISNPVYLHPRGYRFKPVEPDCRLRFAADSPWVGGTVRLETAVGELIEERSVVPDTLRVTLPASSRIRLRADSGEERMFYIAMENGNVQTLLRYLHDGEFLRDYPRMNPGEVPAEAFRMSEMAEALSSFSMAL